MNQQRQDFENAGIPPDQLWAFVDAFFDQLEPKPGKGRPWRSTVSMQLATRPTVMVQAVLHPDDETGFTLYARQGRTLHAVRGSVGISAIIPVSVTGLLESIPFELDPSPSVLLSAVDAGPLLYEVC